MADTDKQPEIYWPSKRFDKLPDGKQPLVYKGFCALCGIYTRRNLTLAHYIDPVRQFRTSGLICADCFSEVAEVQDDDDLDDEIFP